MTTLQIFYLANHKSLPMYPFNLRILSMPQSLTWTCPLSLLYAYYLQTEAHMRELVWYPLCWWTHHRWNHTYWTRRRRMSPDLSCRSKSCPSKTPSYRYTHSCSYRRLKTAVLREFRVAEYTRWRELTSSMVTLSRPSSLLSERWTRSS